MNSSWNHHSRGSRRRLLIKSLFCASPEVILGDFNIIFYLKFPKSTTFLESLVAEWRLLSLVSSKTLAPISFRHSYVFDAIIKNISLFSCYAAGRIYCCNDSSIALWFNEYSRLPGIHFCHLISRIFEINY